MEFIDSELFITQAWDKNYNFYLVFLSVFIAIIASFTAFGITERIYTNTHRVQQMLWVGFGSVVLGTGIWVMHFIGSLALQLPTMVTYKLNLTLVSVIPAICTSAIVFWLLNQSQPSLSRIILCGWLLGSGIAGMHYIGMAAMELNAQMLYSKPVFILSIIVSIILATAALKIQVSVSDRSAYSFICKKQTIGALVMGFAISSIHYTAMQAVIFIPVERPDYITGGIDSVKLAIIIVLVFVLMLIIALLIPHLLRVKQMIQRLKKNELDLRISAMAFQSHEGIMVTNLVPEIIRVNEAFCRITGFSEDEVIGRNPNILSSGRQDKLFYKNFWDALKHEGRWSGEIWNRRKNGEIFPEWQSVSAVFDHEQKITHYIAFFSDITEFKLSEEKIEKLAFYDALTQLPNRRLLHDRLKHELSIARRHQQVGALLFLDLDRFKQINDSLGHSIGDQLLVETAKRLLEILRDTDTAVRLGGDEFIILVNAQSCSKSKLLEQLTVIAEKVIHSINSPYLIAGHELFISTSIGITLYEGIKETVEILLKRADTAMYQAKDAGRNTYRFYQESMQNMVDGRLKMENNLRYALANNELSLHYQPQFSADRQLIGAEALIRWHNPKLGFISPAEFIPIAEDSGLIIPIGEWIVEQVCLQIQQWDKQGIFIPHIAINISPRQFHQTHFVSQWITSTSQYALKPDRLMLEITEGVFLGNLNEAIDKMKALNDKGFSFSIDDFGTGYSSLTYLKHLPFKQLKIDQAFIRDMLDYEADAAIVKAIVVMSQGMDLELIAEGVETKQHLDYLYKLGCDCYQGYFFSKPLSAEELTNHLGSNLIDVDDASVTMSS